MGETTEPTLDAPRVRTAVERAALTTPNGLPWTKRAMPPEHVERLRNGHLCHGYDCVTCVWVATLDALLAEKDRRIGELTKALRLAGTRLRGNADHVPLVRKIIADALDQGGTANG